jgi:hypothetical protein
LATYRRCLQQYDWKYIGKHFPPSGIGQVRGTCGHAAIADWHTFHNEQQAMDVAWNQWNNAGYLESNADWLLLESALNRYFGYSSEHDTFQMIKSEEKFDIPLELADGTPIIFTGYIDGIIQDKDGLWLMEHKFLKQIDNGTKDLDHQSSLYLLACHHLGYAVKGVLYNQIRMGTKIAETEPVVRRRVTRNLAGLAHIEQELLSQAGAMLKFEEGGGSVYRNPTKDCGWDCSFYSACLSLQDDGIEPTAMLQKLSETRRQENGNE